MAMDLGGKILICPICYFYVGFLRRLKYVKKNQGVMLLFFNYHFSVLRIFVPDYHECMIHAYFNLPLLRKFFF